MVSTASNNAAPPAQALLWHGDRALGMVSVQGISDAGVFVFDQMGVPVGAQVVLMFPTPGGGSVDMRGRVLHVVTPDEARRTMRATGMVVELVNAAEPEATATPAPQPEPEPDAPTATPVILIIDDDRVLAKLIETWLGGLGYECRKAINGAQAMTLLEEDDIEVSVAIVDSLLPDTSGEKLIRKILGVSKATKIISTSGVFTRNDSKSQVFSAGATTFLPKPLDQDTVIRAVQHLLAGGGRQSSMMMSASPGSG